MTKIFRWANLIFLAIFLQACSTTTTFVPLKKARGDLDKLIEQKASTDADLSGDFGSLGQKAFEASQDPGLDPSNKISFLRIATQAALEGGESLENEFKTYRGEGKTQCDALDSVRAPTRDCVLLVVFPTWFYSNKATSTINKIKKTVNAGNRLSLDEWGKLNALVADAQYRVSTTSEIMERCNIGFYRKYGNAPPDVQEKIKKQFEIMKANGKGLFMTLKKAIQLETEREPHMAAFNSAKAMADQMKNDRFPENCF